MNFKVASLLPLLALIACGDDPSTMATTDGDSGVPGADAIAPGVDGGSGGGNDAAPSPDGSSPGNDSGSSSNAWLAGNPGTKCSTPIPAAGKAADVSNPTSVVGTGTPASCTFAALDAAVTKGGVITFNCGSAPVTIAVTATMHLPINKDTVIDGGQKVTLDGGGTTQMLRFDSPNFRALETRVTLQHLRMINGMIAGSSPIPKAPAPCSQGFNAGEGGALYMRDGNLSVIDCIFENNKAATSGPDVGGGAIRMLGSKHGITIVGSTFKNNAASNGGAVGCLFAEMDIYDTLVDSNVATGHDANNNDPKQCSAMNNGQNEIGSGGNGGGVYSDGASVNVTLCGDAITNNNAGVNAFGGGLFFTSNDFGGTLTIADTTMSGNTGGSWTSVKTGSTKNAGTAVGTNALSLTITNSKLQGVP